MDKQDFKGYNALHELIKLEVQVIALQKAFRHIIDNNENLNVPDGGDLNYYHLSAVEETKLKYENLPGIDDLIY